VRKDPKSLSSAAGCASVRAGRTRRRSAGGRAPTGPGAPAPQAAALAEFRADWATAVKTYQTAYAELCRAPRLGAAPLQRWAELCAVAELVHLKARPSGSGVR